MKEPVTITLTRIRDKAGRPSCACDFKTGEVCEYYRTQRFGTSETCIFALGGGKYGGTMSRRTSSLGVPGDGTLIPGEWCPLWTKSELEGEVKA